MDLGPYIGLAVAVLINAVVVGRLFGRLEAKAATTAKTVEGHGRAISALDTKIQEAAVETASVRGTWIRQIENLQQAMKAMQDKMDLLGKDIAEIGVLRTRIEDIYKALVRIEGKLP